MKRQIEAAWRLVSPLAAVEGRATWTEPPEVSEIRRLLGERMASLLAIHPRDLLLSLLSKPQVADGTTVVLIGDRSCGARAVMLLSAHVSPLAVEEAMSRATRAKSALAQDLGSRLVDPLWVDRLDGLSYAILPYCRPFSDSRPVWWSQKMLLGSAVFDWLREVNERTLGELSSSQVNGQYVEPLRYLAAMTQMEASLRRAATRAIARIEAGDWVPRSVLMHGDFWKGNILLRPLGKHSAVRKLSERFVVIDWGGSLLCGYPIYDFIRIAQSFNPSSPSLRRDFERHCEILRCEAIDAQSYLAAALGAIAGTLNHFPLDRFLVMADTCFAGVMRLSRDD